MSLSKSVLVSNYFEVYFLYTLHNLTVFPLKYKFSHQLIYLFILGHDFINQCLKREEMKDSGVCVESIVVL